MLGTVKTNSQVTFSFGLLHMDSSVLDNQQIFVDSGWRQEDLTKAMTDWSMWDSKESVLSTRYDDNDDDIALGS